METCLWHHRCWTPVSFRDNQIRSCGVVSRRCAEAARWCTAGAGDHLLAERTELRRRIDESHALIPRCVARLSVSKAPRRLRFPSRARLLADSRRLAVGAWSNVPGSARRRYMDPWRTFLAQLGLLRPKGELRIGLCDDGVVRLVIEGLRRLRAQICLGVATQRFRILRVHPRLGAEVHALRGVKLHRLRVDQGTSKVNRGVGVLRLRMMTLLGAKAKLWPKANARGYTVNRAGRIHHSFPLLMLLGNEDLVSNTSNSSPERVPRHRFLG